VVIVIINSTEVATIVKILGVTVANYRKAARMAIMDSFIDYIGLEDISLVDFSWEDKTSLYLFF